MNADGSAEAFAHGAPAREFRAGQNAEPEVAEQPRTSVRDRA
jgi:hypothetical protein